METAPSAPSVMMMNNFKEVVVQNQEYRVTFEWIGEGNEGDYQIGDESDTPLLRFSVDRNESVLRSRKTWVAVEDGSYCTQMPLYTDKRIIKAAALHILAALGNRGRWSVKKTLERMSWIRPELFMEETSPDPMPAVTFTK